MQKVYKSHLKINHYKKAHTKNYQLTKKFRGYFITHMGILGGYFYLSQNNKKPHN